MISLNTPEPAEPDVYQPDPPSEPPRRIPNLGHALLFISFAGMILLSAQLLLMATGRGPTQSPTGEIAISHPKLEIATEAVTYLLTILAAWRFYPILWRRSFLDGIQWTWSTATRLAVRLIPLGLLLGMLAYAAENLFTPPKSLPIDNFFQSASDGWILTFFGIFVAPAFEEITFRGFLFPAVAIAYDWLSLSRTPEAHARWQTTTQLSRMGLIFSAILTSMLFAIIHGQQVAFTWPVLAVLFCVSLVLTFVRAKTNSVAASTMVHAAYNSLVFIGVIVYTGGYRHLDRMSH